MNYRPQTLLKRGNKQTFPVHLQGPETFPLRLSGRDFHCELSGSVQWQQPVAGAKDVGVEDGLL